MAWQNKFPFFHTPWWRGIGLTGLGCCVGALSLLAAAYSYGKLTGWAVFASYFMHPLVAAVNLLVPIGLLWLVYSLTDRAWLGYLISFLPTIGLTVVNYYKIRLRGDPLLAGDLRLASEAGGIVGNYTLELTWIIWLILFCFLLGLAGSIFLFPRPHHRWRTRLLAAGAWLLALAVSVPAIYLNPTIYDKTANTRFINPWSDVEVFVSKGCVYPFLYSMRDMFPTPPADYDKQAAQKQLESYPDADIPEDRAVNVVGIMLEAFCDLTDFSALADHPAVSEVYAPWHQLEQQSVSGNLLTNIFAGGTVDSEWGFLSGYTTHGEFRKNTDSYVWYFREQGYDTIFHHAGYGWFYNRQNVNQYLGFNRSWFTENHYGSLVSPEQALYDSDHILFQEILSDLRDRFSEGKSSFSFSVTYQNHGPYATDCNMGKAYLTPEADGLPEESCYIFNNYLHNISSTLSALTTLTQELEAQKEPVVLVLFGDHKPWGGNGNTAYNALGADFSLNDLDSFRQYYSTPYLIWANSAARTQLGGTWTGDGGEFSPCFLMNKVFELCSWDGPGAMQMANEMKALTPLVHQQGLYLSNGALTDTLPDEQAQALSELLCAQYYREQEVVK